MANQRLTINICVVLYAVIYNVGIIGEGLLEKVPMCELEAGCVRYI